MDGFHDDPSQGMKGGVTITKEGKMNLTVSLDRTYIEWQIFNGDDHIGDVVQEDDQLHYYHHSGTQGGGDMTLQECVEELRILEEEWNG